MVESETDKALKTTVDEDTKRKVDAVARLNGMSTAEFLRQLVNREVEEVSFPKLSV